MGALETSLNHEEMSLLAGLPAASLARPQLENMGKNVNTPANSMDANSQGRIRVGAVNYLNTKPLVYGLAQSNPQIQLSFDLPSRLADQLAAGHLDVALIPSVESFQNPAYRIVSDACIACRGPVWSVKLFGRKPFSEVKTLALDVGSRTSAALSRLLLLKRFGIRPEVSQLPLDCDMQDTLADAVLLIGDRAMHSPPGPFAQVWDLGSEWVKETGLPFVFAMWVAREGVELGELSSALGRARDAGLAHASQIAEVEAAGKGLTESECVDYLTRHLHFYLGPREREAVELFRAGVQELGCITGGTLRADAEIAT